jgi:hypothetical protein
MHMKMIVMFRRKPGLSSEQFREHYEQKHAPLALTLFPYIKAYRRNYIRRDRQHQRAAAEGFDARLDYDAIIEVLFETERDYERMVFDMSDPAIRAQVVTDESRFIDRSATVVFLADEVASMIASADGDSDSKI